MKRPPGLLPKNENPDVLLMIGTAGHVDHGKTRLVRFLTGCETDRLRAEKERGLTIELGFAPCVLGPGIAAGIVDVPGHEQFIKNMVTGAAGMDLTILVVAADDGVMPQTVEHLQIMQFLGVRHGLVALTKIDLVSPERVEAACEQIRNLIEGTFLEGAVICPVSSETLEGFETFYHRLTETASAAKVTREKTAFRMPVERVFSPPGHGTVVTGIPQGGEVGVGDELSIQPSETSVRVRGIQCFLREAERGRVGQCLALNLAGVARDGIRRGDVVALPGLVTACRLLQVRLVTCPDMETALRDGETLRLHTGTLEAQAKLNIYTGKKLEPGGEGFGTLRLYDSAAIAPTDRFVLRRNSPAATVAGGIVLHVAQRRARGTRALLAEEMAARWAAFDSPKTRFEYHLSFSGMQGASLREAAREALLEEEDARSVAKALVEREALVSCEDSDRFLHVSGRDAARRGIVSCITTYYEANPSAYGPSIDEVQAALRIPSVVWKTVERLMVESGELERSGSRVALSRRRQAGAEWMDELRRIEALYLERGFVTPRPDEVPEMTGIESATVLRLLDRLCQERRLVRLGKNVLFHSALIEEAERRVVVAIQKDGSLNSADFKQVIGASRKYALAILDHFDTRQVTQRFGNLRKLHPSYLRRHPQKKP